MLIAEAAKRRAATSRPIRTRRPATSSAPTISRSPSAACRRSRFGSGNDLVEGGVARGKALGDDYTAKRYHQPADEWTPSGTSPAWPQDAQLLYAVGQRLANSRDWPNWSAGQRIPRGARQDRCRARRAGSACSEALHADRRRARNAG